MAGLSRRERTVLLLGALWFGLVLGGYYILRPIREQISATHKLENLSWLFAGTLTTMLVAVPVFSLLVGSVHRRVLVPLIYTFFICNLLAFRAGMKYLPSYNQVYIASAFFIWVSVYGLFVVSFFWSVIGDLISTAQGRRLFGYISGGGTIGGMIGSQVAARTVTKIGNANLILIPAVLLVFGLIVYFYLEAALRSVDLTDEEPAKRSSATQGNATGGNPFAGITAVFQSRYLVSIALFSVLLSTCSTTVYFQQAEIVKATFETSEAKTQYFADVNFAVQIVTLVFQFLVVSFLMRNVGLGWTLACLPIAYLIGIGSLAVSPSIAVLAVISTLGRAAEYGIANPAREVLFTSVDREDRYKAKNFIDTVARRSGDAAVGYGYGKLRETVGLAMSTMSYAVLPVVAVWFGLALFIGRENKRIAHR